MCEVLKRMGYEDEEVELPELSSCEIHSTADELEHLETMEEEAEGKPGNT